MGKPVFSSTSRRLILTSSSFKIQVIPLCAVLFPLFQLQYFQGSLEVMTFSLLLEISLIVSSFYEVDFFQLHPIFLHQKNFLTSLKSTIVDPRDKTEVYLNFLLIPHEYRQFFICMMNLFIF